LQFDDLIIYAKNRLFIDWGIIFFRNIAAA